MVTPEEIVKNSKYKENAIIEQQDEIIEALVNEWNNIITDMENRTIRFSLRVEALLKGFPEKTISEVIDKVRNHPDLKQAAHSKARILQGLRLVRERKDLLEFNELTPEKKQKISFKKKPYCKRDGGIFWEYYFELYKYNIDPGMRSEFEEKGKNELWSKRKLIREIGGVFDEKRTPHAKRRFEKRDLIREIVIMLKDLEPQELKMIRGVIVEEYKDKLEYWKAWKKKKEED